MTFTEIIELLGEYTSTHGSATTNYPIAKKTRDINNAFDDYQNVVKRVAGSWQADDTNHTKYPNLTFDLTSGQKDYTFTQDEQGNQIQDIYRVEIKDANGRWKVLKYVDEMNYQEAISQIDTESGTPEEYYLTANGVFLVTAPNYTQANGIRMFFTRSPDYFTVSNTTKEPGIPNGHHRYLPTKAAYWFWMPKDTAKANTYLQESLRIEESIKHEYADRKRDETFIVQGESVNPY